MNTLTIVGRIVSDCVMANAPFDLAINTIASVPSTNKGETMFLPFKVYGKLAREIFTRYCKKGDLVVLFGTLTEDSFENQEGKKTKKFWLIVDKLKIVGSRNQIEETPDEFMFNANPFNDVSNPPKQQKQPQKPQPKQNVSENPFDMSANPFVNEGDLPF